MDRGDVDSIVVKVYGQSKYGCQSELGVEVVSLNSRHRYYDYADGAAGYIKARTAEAVNLVVHLVEEYADVEIDRGAL